MFSLLSVPSWTLASPTQTQLLLEKLQSPEIKSLVFVFQSPVDMSFAKKTSPQMGDTLSIKGPLESTIWWEDEGDGVLLIRDASNEGSAKPGSSQWIWKGRDLPLQIHLLKGQVQIAQWGQTLSLDLHQGQFIGEQLNNNVDIFGFELNAKIKDMNAPIWGQIFSGNLSLINTHAPVNLRILSGQTRIQNSDSTLHLEQSKGSLSLVNLGPQNEILTKTANVQFSEQMGQLSVQSEDGFITGQMGSQGHYELSSQTGKVAISGLKYSPHVDILNEEGEIYVPNKTNRVFRGPAGEKRLKGNFSTDANSSEAGTAKLRVRAKSGNVSLNP